MRFSLEDRPEWHRLGEEVFHQDFGVGAESLEDALAGLRDRFDAQERRTIVRGLETALAKGTQGDLKRLWRLSSADIFITRKEDLRPFLEAILEHLRDA